MLYESAIAFLQQAIAEFEGGDLEAGLHHVGKARDIVGELSAVLDVASEGASAGRLGQLYGILDTFLPQSAKRDISTLHDTRKILEELNDIWKMIAC
jgi:flagellar biosynthetic protein FliS